MPKAFHEVRIESLSPARRAAMSAAARGGLAVSPSGAWEAGGISVHPSLLGMLEQDGWIAVEDSTARLTPEGIRRLALDRGIIPLGMVFGVAEAETPPRVTASWACEEGARTMTVATMGSVGECHEALAAMLERLGIRMD